MAYVAKIQSKGIEAQRRLFNELYTVPSVGF